MKQRASDAPLMPQELAKEGLTYVGVAMTFGLIVMVMVLARGL